MTQTSAEYWSRANVFARHGVPDEPQFDAPELMARRLAKYITNASTIRAHVMNEFGRAPAIKTIESFMRPRGHLARALKLVADEQADDRDARDFHVPTVVDAETPAAEIAFRPITLKSDIIAMAEECCGLPRGSIVTRTRDSKIVRARYLAAAVLVLRGSSTAQAGRDLGGIDHGSICYGIRRFIERDLDRHENLRLAWERYAPESLHAVRSYDEFMVAIGRRVA